MRIKKIVSELEFYRGYYPEEALREAVARKEEIIPELLHTLKKSISNLPFLNQYRFFNGYIFAFYLLAQFREKEAFPMIIEFFTYLENDPYDFTGVLVTETLDRILASVFDGDLSSLQYVTLDQECEQFIRLAFLDAILILYKNELISRKDMVEVYRSIFNNLEREKNYIWHSLVEACAIAGIDELKDLISETYKDELIDRFELPLDEVMSSLESEHYRYCSGRNYDLIDDVIEESNWWSCYTKKPEELAFYSGMSSLGKSIISELENYYGYFPEDALNKAIENKETIIPDLLKVLEWTANNPNELINIDFIIPIFSCFLLGKFQEKRAFPKIINLVISGIHVNSILSEFVFYDLSGIMASCYNGDYELLKENILDENIDQEIRTSFLECFIVLYQRQEIDRDIYIEILQDIFSRLKQTYSSIWDKLVDACIVSQSVNFLPEIINAYVNGLFEPWYSQKEIEEMLKGNKESGLDDISKFEEEICDTEWWGYVELGTREYFDLHYLERKEFVLNSLIENKKPRSKGFDDHYSEPLKPYIRKGVKIGRNDPCPCGSGKKYKKCCGKNI